ncbi:MAG: hypothetical protein Q7R54_03315 [bacterium]|nr:hypothetical protein [bacterium]
MKMTFSLLENNLLVDAASKPLSVRTLYKKYVAGKRCSRAGFYKALYSLKKKEVVLEENGTLSVNKIWLAESYAFFKKVTEQKTEPSYLAKQVTQLLEGEKLTYTFRSIADIDIFILNILYDLLLLKTDSKVFICEPHEFFVLFNNVRTAHILREINNIKGSVFLLIESTSELDKEIVKTHLVKPAEGYVSSRAPKNVSLIRHTIGDICIDLHLDRLLANEIDSLFSKQTKIYERTMGDLEDLAHKRQKHKIVIYKSAEKARKTKSKFGKYFPKV